MKVPLANLGTATALALNFPASGAKSPAGTSGSFALEISAAWAGSQVTDADSIAPVPTASAKQPGDTQTQCQFVTLAAPTDESTYAPKSDIVRYPNIGGDVPPGAAPAPSSVLQNIGIPEAVWSFDTQSITSPLSQVGNHSSPPEPNHSGNVSVAPHSPAAQKTQQLSAAFGKWVNLSDARQFIVAPGFSPAGAALKGGATTCY
jgi:hypothetical protein